MPTANEYLKRFFQGVLSPRAFVEATPSAGAATSLTFAGLADSGLSADFWRRARMVRVSKAVADVDYERVVTATTPGAAGLVATHGGVNYADTDPTSPAETAWLVKLPAGWSIFSMYDLLNQALESCFDWESVPMTMVPYGDMRGLDASILAAWSDGIGAPVQTISSAFTFAGPKSLRIVCDAPSEFVQSQSVSVWPGEPFLFEATFTSRGAEPRVGVWNVDAGAWVPGFPIGAGLATARRALTARWAFNVPANCYNLAIRAGGDNGVDLYLHEAVLQSGSASDFLAPTDAEQAIRSSNQPRHLTRMSPGDRAIDKVVIADTREPIERINPEIDVMNSFGDSVRLKVGKRVGEDTWRLEYVRPYRVPGVDAAIRGTELSACPLEYAVAMMAELFYKSKAAPENGSDELVNLAARDYWRTELTRRALEFKPRQEETRETAYSYMGHWGPA